jgi:hypothetical protein
MQPRIAIGSDGHHALHMLPLSLLRGHHSSGVALQEALSSRLCSASGAHRCVTRGLVQLDMTQCCDSAHRNGGLRPRHLCIRSDRLWQDAHHRRPQPTGRSWQPGGPKRAAARRWCLGADAAADPGGACLSVHTDARGGQSASFQTFAQQAVSNAAAALPRKPQRHLNARPIASSLRCAQPVLVRCSRSRARRGVAPRHTTPPARSWSRSTMKLSPIWLPTKRGSAKSLQTPTEATLGRGASHRRLAAGPGRDRQRVRRDGLLRARPCAAPDGCDAVRLPMCIAAVLCAWRHRLQQLHRHILHQMTLHAVDATPSVLLRLAAHARDATAPSYLQQCQMLLCSRNATSSRSHCIMGIELLKQGKHKSTVWIVDQCGSEQMDLVRLYGRQRCVLMQCELDVISILCRF